MANLFSRLTHLVKKSKDETLSHSITRRLGFFSVALVEFLLNINFFSSLGESWIMPFAGGILVFMNVWHWVSAQSANGVRRVLHYTAWLTIAVMSVLAVISFGQAITTISSADVAKAAVVQTNQDSVRQSLLTAAQTDLSAAQADIADLIAKKGELTKYDSKSRAAIDESMKIAEGKKADALARIEKYSGLDESAKSTAAGAVSAESVKQNMSARYIFGQIFSEEQTTTAIKFFFLIFGIAIQLTLSLSSLPPKKDKKRNGLFSYLGKLIMSKVRMRESIVNAREVAPAQPQPQPLVIMTPQYQPPIPAPAPVPAPEPVARKKTPKPAPVVEEVDENIPDPELEATPPQVLTHGEQLAEQSLSSDIHDYESLEEKKASIETQLEEMAKADVEPIVDKAATLPLKSHESETAFLFANNDTPLKTLDAAEKGGFISNIQSIFNEIKRNGDKELSIKEISDRTNISIVEIRRMFKFFYNRNLLTYDEVSKRWKFKLNKDNIINYLRDKTIEY